jgi:putative flavoprotein involved in K+ transport
MTQLTDCVVVGAGPAGLAASASLVARGVDHVVLERGRAGETWRTQRWDSLRLNNPGWMNPMLGKQPRDTYLTAAEVVTRLERLASLAPVRENTPVIGVLSRGEAWTIRTADVELNTRAVVLATGGENVPLIPRLARLVPDHIAQCHAASYRAPDQLPDGAVLVVGSAQSGYQISQELLRAGRRVYLATSPVGRAPATHRGRDTLEWLVECGFFDQRPEELVDRSVISAPQPLLAPGGRSASLQTLARSGATLLGRLVNVEGDQVTFASDLARTIAAADAYAARIRAVLDEAIARAGRSAPPMEVDEADAPVHLDPPTQLQLREHDITSVLWCTGYRGDFSWLNPALTDHDGRPRRHGAAALAPGLWYMGLRWLTRRSSGNFLGFPADAAIVADAVTAALQNGRRPAANQPSLVTTLGIAPP